MKAYRIVDRSNSQLLRDSLIRNGQILLPMVELIEARSKGTLLTYRNNFVPASEPWLAENEQPTLRARLNGPGSQHTLPHYAVSSPFGHIQGISESPCPVFPVIQQRPLFSSFTARATTCPLP